MFNLNKTFLWKQEHLPPPPQWCGAISRPLFLFILSFTLALTSCDKSKDIAQPSATELSTSQAQDAKKDDDYKRDKTGQYVSKDVQVTGYEDGSERPTRPKHDAGSGEIGAKNVPICDPCDGGGGTYTPPVYSGFVSSELNSESYNYPYQTYVNLQNYIYDLKIIKGSSSTIGVDDPGYYKINVDLNKGAGGKYIYLAFTRDPEKVKGSSSWIYDGMKGSHNPVRNIYVKSNSFGYGFNMEPSNCAAPIETKDFLGYHQPDLNDGAGGKYIYAWQEKCSTYTPNHPNPIREVGVIYGNSSTIQPPSPWIRISGDLNEGAGGDYIYFCIKY